MASKNTINQNFWQIANANTDGDIVKITTDIVSNTTDTNIANITTAVIGSATITSANISNISNIKIGGGATGQFLQTDGNGNLIFATVAGGGSSAGSNGQLQFNDNGAAGGANITIDKANNTVSFGTAQTLLGEIGNVKITGGNNGQFLQTDGQGNLAWSTVTSGGNGSATPGGSNSQLQFNNSGAFGGIANITYNKVSDTLSLNSNTSFPNISRLAISGGSATQILSTNGNGVLSWTDQYTDSRVGNVLRSYTGNISAGNLSVSGTSNLAGNVNLTGTKIYLGNVSNIQIGGGSSGQVLASDGANGVQWVDAGTGGANGVVGNASLFFNEIVKVIPTAQTGTYNFDVYASAIKYSTASATSNVVLNFRGNSITTLNSLMPSETSVTTSYVMTTGNTAYTISGVQIDGVTQTVKYVGGSIPPVYANSTITFTYTIIKKTSLPTYTVLGSLTRYA
jgi:hypothetical protein